MEFPYLSLTPQPVYPVSKVYRWCQILKNSRIHSINNALVTSTSNVPQMIQTSMSDVIELTVIPPTPTHIHPETGIPQLNFDQFIHIASIHLNILEDTKSILIHEEIDDLNHLVVNKLQKNALTCATLMKQTDWPDWEQSEFYNSINMKHKRCLICQGRFHPTCNSIVFSQ